MDMSLVNASLQLQQQQLYQRPQQPSIVIVEEPMPRVRFRYASEGEHAGNIYGASSTTLHQTFPTIMVSFTFRVNLILLQALCKQRASFSAVLCGFIYLSIHVCLQNLLPDLDRKWLGQFRWNLAGRTILGSSIALQKIVPRLSYCPRTLRYVLRAKC